MLEETIEVCRPYRIVGAKVFRPAGAAIGQPRATPWVDVTNGIERPERAAQLNERTGHSLELCRPFRAADVFGVTDPKAMPWDQNPVESGSLESISVLDITAKN